MGWEIGRPGTTPPTPSMRCARGSVPRRSCPRRHSCTAPHSASRRRPFRAAAPSSCAPTRASIRPALLDLVEREHVAVLGIVGDTFARPIVEELERTGAHRDLRELHAIVSSGMRFSAENKTRLVELVPGVTVVDSLGSSEGMMTRSTVSARDNSDGMSFAAGERGPRDHRRRTRRGAGLRRRRTADGDGPPAAAVPQRSGEDGGDVPDHRRRRASPRPATAPASGPTVASSSSAVGRRASTPAARRSTRRRSRTCCAATSGSPTPPSSGSPTNAGARWSSPSSNPRPTVTAPAPVRGRRTQRRARHDVPRPPGRATSGRSATSSSTSCPRTVAGKPDTVRLREHALAS